MKGWKVQKFFGDLVYDLRSRGLLPFVVVLAIAIVTAPIVIKSMGSSDSAPAGAPQVASAEPAPEGKAAVVAYEPGLRNYRDRLDGLSSKNPFKQQYAPKEEGAQGGDGGGSGGGAGSGGGTSSGTKTITITETTKSKQFYYYYETDLRSGETGGQLRLRNDVPAFTILPSQQAPAAVYLGVAGGGKQAIFSVSRNVTAVSGQGECYPDPENCELLGIGSGQAADLRYGEDGKSYRIEIARIRFVKSKNPPD